VRTYAGGPVGADTLAAALVQVTAPEQAAAMAHAAWEVVTEGAEVTDTQKMGGGKLSAHQVTVTRGTIGRNDALQLEVDHRRRGAIRANHSATHLMHEALRRRATLQEVCDVLRDEYGGYVPHDVF
jgi:hypothetical protein